ncbi:MAG: hypothetical protein LBG64_00940 [Pseudomonadales bacterium]|jgi:hypothetical protein|nr:hypothetical protein [Pseudomonadales bacterium]
MPSDEPITLKKLVKNMQLIAWMIGGVVFLAFLTVPRVLQIDRNQTKITEMGLRIDAIEREYNSRMNSFDLTVERMSVQMDNMSDIMLEVRDDVRQLKQNN